jgi:hypothetical protein
MAWFSKKSDPISERARALSEQIAGLESEIKRLDAQLQRRPDQPRLRPAAIPSGAPGGSRETSGSPGAHEPIFEEVDMDRLTAQADAAGTPQHYNELGVRKYDLPALLRRLRQHFRGPSTTNPKLVSYLAAGGIQGLRPLRYEKRVARNRFIFLVTALFLVLLGLILAFARHSR